MINELKECYFKFHAFKAIRYLISFLKSKDLNRKKNLTPPKKNTSFNAQIQIFN